MATVVFGAISAIAAVSGAVSARKGQKEQIRQNQIRNRIAATRRIRNVRRRIAEARIRRAEVQAQGVTLGVGGGTAVQGAVGGITSDLFGAIGASNQQFTGAQAIAESQNRISGLQQRASTAGAISNLAGQFDDQSIDAIQNLFA